VIAQQRPATTAPDRRALAAIVFGGRPDTREQSRRTRLKGRLTMKVQILGTGCPKCRLLTQNAEQALRELGIGAEIEKIEKIADIVRMGVMVTPGLAIDGQVRSSGHLLSVEQIKQILQTTVAAAPATAARPD